MNGLILITAAFIIKNLLLAFTSTEIFFIKTATLLLQIFDKLAATINITIFQFVCIYNIYNYGVIKHQTPKMYKYIQCSVST